MGRTWLKQRGLRLRTMTGPTSMRFKSERETAVILWIARAFRLTNVLSGSWRQPMNLAFEGGVTDVIVED